jgi:hypothetical protein
MRNNPNSANPSTDKSAAATGQPNMRPYTPRVMTCIGVVGDELKDELNIDDMSLYQGM